MQRIAVASGTSTLREGYCLHLCKSRVYLWFLNFDHNLWRTSFVYKLL
jgi:hypothetical protein